MASTTVPARTQGAVFWAGFLALAVSLAGVSAAPPVRADEGSPLGGPAEPVGGGAPDSSAAGHFEPSAEEAQVFSLIAASRAGAGVGQIAWDPVASDAARQHSRQMVEDDFFYYTNSEGVGAVERLQRSGRRFAYWGENLALDRSVPRSHEADMVTAGLRENILDARFATVGIGVVARPDQMLLITVVFLAP